MNDTLATIRSEALAVAINPLGAELWSMTDNDGRELMTNADPRWWTGHAPILFPFVGRSRGDVYRLDGQEYPMPQHGFARHKLFTLIESDENRALFRLKSDAETRAIYPFTFQLDMEFVVERVSLTMTARVSNLGDADMPFSFGFHPAFAWPLPFGGAPEDHRIIFSHAEPAAIRRIGSEPGMIALAHEPSPVKDHILAPDHAMFERDALIWDHLESRSLWWGVPRQRGLDIGFPDTPWLGIWQKPGAPYLCIEPWAGMADIEGFTGDIWDKQGIMRLPFGQSHSFKMSIRITTIAA